jgi:hypothetical protein
MIQIKSRDNLLVSGTFSGKLKRDGVKIIQITDGRFDVTYFKRAVSCISGRDFRQFAFPSSV